jgi:hypothetical protein
VAQPGTDTPRVWDGETELQVLGMEWLDAPPRIIFVIDSSGSAARLHRPLRKAALDFASAWPGAEGALVAFGSEAQLITPPTADPVELAAGFDALEPGGRNSISSGAGLGLTLAEGHPRAMMVLLTDGFDTPGPVSLSTALDAARCLDVPIYSLGIGNRVEMSLLEELATISGGGAREIRTPLDAAPALTSLHALLSAQEARVRARLVETAPLSQHSISVGAAPDEDAAVIAYGPMPAGMGEIVWPILGPNEEPAPTPILVRADGVPVAFGASPGPIAVPAAEVEVLPATIPRMDPVSVRVRRGETHEMEPLRLGALRVTGPELGLKDGTPVSILSEGEPVMQISTGEWVHLRPGQYRVEVRTAPPWQSDLLTLEPAGRAEAAAPGMGTLRVEVVGAGGETVPATLRLFTADDEPAGTARTGQPRSLPAGDYRVVVPIPPERSVDVTVTPDEETSITLEGYGELEILAHGPLGEPLSLGVTVRTLEGELLLSGRTGETLELGAGRYDIEVDSIPPYSYRPVAVEAGERRVEDLRVFGGLFVTGGDGGRYRLETADGDQLIGRHLVGEILVLLAGEYRIEPVEGSGVPPLPVTVRAGMVSRVDLP